MQAFVITAYKDYEALKTLTLALSRRGLCVIHADAQGAITARQVDELNSCAAWRLRMSAWIICT